MGPLRSARFPVVYLARAPEHTTGEGLKVLLNLRSWRRPATILAVTAAGAATIFLARPAIAQAAGVEGETEFVLNTFAFLVWGALVMWMCAGFTMLESGSVRTKNASMICLKNIGIYSIAGLAYFVIGYNLMYVDVVGDFIGSFNILYESSDAEFALLDGSGDAAAVRRGRPRDHVRLVLPDGLRRHRRLHRLRRPRRTGQDVALLLLHAGAHRRSSTPIVGAWTWGGGWLADLGFQDFAGSTVVHGVGGWAALAGIVVIGPRLGKFRPRREGVRPTPPSNVLVVTLGVFILWLGWFGFNGGSQLALASAFDAVSMANVLVNTNLAAAAGVSWPPSASPASSWGASTSSPV